MDERENLPAVIAAQAVAVLSEQRGSLVARGISAILANTLSLGNDALYRQARTEFDRELWMIDWRENEHPERLRAKPIVADNWMIKDWQENEHPALFSAFKVFQQLAGENYGKAYFPLSCLYHEVGRFYLLRAGGQKNKESEEFHSHARHFSRMAFDWCFANKDNQDAELWCDLGEMYHDKSSRDEQFNEEIRYWLTEQEDIIPDYAIGLFWAAEQESQAVYWFRKAAEQGDARGQLLLGEMYDWGFGVEENFELAVYWFRKAAEQGNANGQYELGNIYTSGMTSKDSLRGRSSIIEQQPNDELAMYWYRKAAEQGHYTAQKHLRELGMDWNK